MGILKTKLLIKHLRLNDKTGKLLKITMEYTHMEVGTSKPFYEMKYDDWDHIVTPTWVTHLWKYWSDAEVQPEISDMWTYIPSRKNDVHIMDQLLPHPPNKTIQHILNTC